MSSAAGAGAVSELASQVLLVFLVVKVAFFRGASLRPLPPDESKNEQVRYLAIRENDEPDEKPGVVDPAGGIDPRLGRRLTALDVSWGR